MGSLCWRHGLRLAFLYCEVQRVGVIDLAFVFSTPQRGEMCPRHMWEHKKIESMRQGGGGERSVCSQGRTKIQKHMGKQASDIHTQPSLVVEKHTFPWNHNVHAPKQNSGNGMKFTCIKTNAFNEQKTQMKLACKTCFNSNSRRILLGVVVVTPDANSHLDRGLYTA